tara:strand:+ start:76 stop:600 length:525 start_codon:yes stop_codon:yes gene_type:complete
MKSKKAQSRMTETIGVMFIFFILILFGIIFYTKYSEVAFQEKQAEKLGKQAVEITSKTIFLPELICSRGEAEPELYCLDLLKVKQAQKTFKDNFGDYYFDLFPFTKITISEIYPGNATYLLYDKPKTTRLSNGTMVKSKQKESTHFLLTLKDPVKSKEKKGEYSFGILTVEVYS